MLQLVSPLVSTQKERCDCIPVVHRRLQTCVGTWARLGYAAFDAQLREAYFFHYTVCYTYVCAYVSMCMLYRGSGGMPRVFVSGPPDMSMHDSK